MLFGTWHYWKCSLRNGTWYGGAAACTNKMAFFVFFFFLWGIMPTPGWETPFCQHALPLCFQTHATSFATAWLRSMSSLAVFIYLKFIASPSKLDEFCRWGTCFLQCLLSLWLQHQHFNSFGNGWCSMKRMLSQQFRGGIDQPHSHLRRPSLGYQYQNRKPCEKC